jgi:hypothetical protein
LQLLVDDIVQTFEVLLLFRDHHIFDVCTLFTYDFFSIMTNIIGNQRMASRIIRSELFVDWLTRRAHALFGAIDTRALIIAEEVLP